MILIFLSLSVVLVFFSEALSLDPEKLPTPYRIAFAILLIVYAGIRFWRLTNQKDTE
jgi:hypothetical protein